MSMLQHNKRSLKISAKSAQTQDQFALPSNSPQIGSISDFNLRLVAGDTLGTRMKATLSNQMQLIES